MGYLATTPSLLWLINQEDMTKEPDQQNLPGTTAEYPNWSRKMQWSVEDLSELPAAKDCAAMIRYWKATPLSPVYNIFNLVTPSTRPS